MQLLEQDAWEELARSPEPPGSTHRSITRQHLWARLLQHTAAGQEPLRGFKGPHPLGWPGIPCFCEVTQRDRTWVSGHTAVVRRGECGPGQGRSLDLIF